MTVWPADLGNKVSSAAAHCRCFPLCMQSMSEDALRCIFWEGLMGGIPFSQAVSQAGADELRIADHTVYRTALTRTCTKRRMSADGRQEPARHWRKPSVDPRLRRLDVPQQRPVQRRRRGGTAARARLQLVSSAFTFGRSNQLRHLATPAMDEILRGEKHHEYLNP